MSDIEIHNQVSHRRVLLWFTRTVGIGEFVVPVCTKFCSFLHVICCEDSKSPMGRIGLDGIELKLIELDGPVDTFIGSCCSPQCNTNLTSLTRHLQNQEY